MKIYLIPTLQAQHLTRNIRAKNNDFEVISSDLNKDRKRCFPDGEIYMRIFKANKLRGKRVIVLYSGAPNPNEGLMELELILQILRDYQIRPEVFFTYFPYGMQDKVFERGETNVAENLVEKLVNYYNVKKIYIIDPHFEGRKWVRKYPITSISAVALLVEKAKKNFGKDILFLSPDIGGKRRTKIAGLKKKRLDSFKVEMSLPKMNLKKKIVVAIDDMIKTGGTLLKFCEIAKKSGAKKIVALITHGVMSSGISKVKREYSILYLTNTINRKEANVDITNLILENISKA